jgi:hypothetical protein
MKRVIFIANFFLFLVFFSQLLSVQLNVAGEVFTALG